RAGEGASFTGLKPAGAELEPAVKEADRALKFGSVDTLISLVTEDVAGGIRRRFVEALEKSKHKDESVEAGREFVAAYIEYIHYVERLHQDAVGKGIHHGESEESGIEERYNY
ncbi:MAG: DUF6448 family protein, partial [Candidatus Omnitrophica bacterium]|nr:DUF6448 family protein [Candidatus Omnitrophota bacterium]